MVTIPMSTAAFAAIRVDAAALATHRPEEIVVGLIARVLRGLPRATVPSGRGGGLVGQARSLTDEQGFGAIRALSFGRTRMRTALSAFLLAAMSAEAWAVDLPRFDMRLRCASIDDSRGVRACEHSEDAARHAILVSWSRYPTRRKNSCLQAEQLRPTGQRSYVTLSKCLGEPNATG
jgi:hypothetical protein